MQRINDILKKNNISGVKYYKNGKCIIVDAKDNKIVIRPNKTNIYEYLYHRNFNNIPNIYIDSGYEIYDYIEDIDIPVEQKMIELVQVISNLHKKTTYYKKISEFDLDKIYKDVLDRIDKAKLYYDELVYDAENTIYMSPSQYILCRNISSVYSNINYCSEALNKWYKEIKKNDRLRVSVIHNNLELNHFINNTLISWDKSRIGISVYDLYKLYTNTYNEYDWLELISIYNHNFKLKEDEILLFSTLISIPLIPDIGSIEIDNVKNIQEIINYLKLTNDYIIKIKDEKVL